MPRCVLPNGVSIHYEEYNAEGSPAVLLLHGLGSAGADWLLQFKGLGQAGYRVLAPDLRGFGRSSWPGFTSVPAMAKDMALLLEVLVEERAAHVVGISMGGTVALQLALDFPELVDKLVLVNTFARLRPQGVRGHLYFIARLLVMYTLGAEAQAHLVARRIFPRPEQDALRLQLRWRILHTPPNVYRAAMWALARFDVENRLGDVQAPTLVITGSEDTTVPPSAQRLLAEHIPGAQQVIIPGAGHAVILDSPAAFNATLLTFLLD